MCVVSAIGDDFGRRWPYPSSPSPGIYPEQNPWDKKDEKYNPFQQFLTNISKEDFEKLKKEVEDLRIILEQAKLFDDKNNEPNCHMDEKVALIKQFSKVFGISFNGIFEATQLVVEEAPAFEPFRVVGADGEVGRFADKELANKFADYLTKYNGNEYAVVSVVDDSHLKFAVIENGILIAKFFEEYTADDFVSDKSENWFGDEPARTYQIIKL